MNKPNKVKVNVDHETGYWCVEVNKQPPKPPRKPSTLLPRFWAWVERRTAPQVFTVIAALVFLYVLWEVTG